MFKFFQKKNKRQDEKFHCVRCKEMERINNSTIVVTYNSQRLPLCEVHMSEFIDSLKRDPYKIQYLDKINSIGGEEE